MSTEENKALARRFADERWNKGNLDICDEMFAPGINIQAEREWLRSIHAIYSDIQYTFLDILAEGDRVVIHWRFSGTHRGEHLGVAPSGNRVTVQGLALIRIVDGKVVEDLSYWDDLSVLNQLRGLPAIRAADGPKHRGGEGA